MATFVFTGIDIWTDGVDRSSINFTCGPFRSAIWNSDNIAIVRAAMRIRFRWRMANRVLRLRNAGGRLVRCLDASGRRFTAEAPEDLSRGARLHL